MAKVNVDVENILKKMGEDGKPALSLKVVKEVVNQVEYLFRKEGYGIIDSGTNTPNAILPPTSEVDIQVVVPKFKASKPHFVKKGDLFLGYSINGKARPIVVAKVVKDTAYCICLTTTEDEYTLIPHQSRFLEEGFYTNSFVEVKLSHIKKSFIGIIDDTRNLNKAIKLIKEKYKKELL